MGPRKNAGYLRADTRGAGLVEYLVVVGLVAIAATAGFKVFGTSVLGKANEHAHCVDTFDCKTNEQQPVAGAESALSGPPITGAGAPSGPLEGIPADAQYTPVEGDVTVTGEGDGTPVHPSDVDQGALADCFLMSAMGAIAQQNPSILENAVRDNGDGTYTVTFHEPNPHPGWQVWESDYRQVQVTVTNELPTRGGNPIFAQPGDGSGDNRELWPMIVEKAYAQWKGGYDDIANGGSSYEAMLAITGQEGEWGSVMTLDDMADAFADGDAIVLGTPENGRGPLFDDGTLVGWHAYFVTGVDRDAGTITVHNPWGWADGEITLTYEQYAAHFNGYNTNPADD